MERVDVIELEPAVLHVARLCEDGNRHVLHNPKVKITIGDAREALLVSRGKYDLIFSEPSNPYRAGVASLYTKEFYEAAAAKMQPGALFLQWVQAYEVDGQTMRTVYATCHSVFPHLETWQTQAGDLLLVGSVLPVRHDAAALRRRVAEEPFRTALADVWRVTDLEGFLSHHIADAAFAADVAKAHAGPLNTDDQTVVEFGFARSVGKPGGVSTAEVLQLAQVRGQGRPAVEGAVDWESVEDQRVAMEAYEGRTPSLPPDAPEHRRTRAEALNHLLQGNAAAGVNTWDRQPRPAASVIEMIFLASALGDTGNDRAEAHLANVRKVQETEADALLANLRWRQRRPIEAAEALQRALVRYRTDPWPHPDLMHRTIALATDVALGDRDGNVARALHDALSRPFSLRLNEDFRLRALVMVSGHLDYVTGSLLLPAALDHFEPHVPWEERFLEMRMVSYRDTNSPKLAQAILDYDEFGSNKPFPFDRGLRPASAPTTATAPTGSTARGSTATGGAATGGAATGGAATGPATAPNAGPRVEPAPAGPSQGRGESLLGPPGANPPSGNAPRPKSQR
jgi:hypothetical protein